MGSVFANDPKDLGSIPRCDILKTFEMVLDTYLLNTQQYKVTFRVKWSNPGKGVALFSTPWCSSLWKESILVALNYGHQLFLNRLIGIVGTVFANGPVDLGSIPGRVIRKTLKMVLDTTLLNTQQYKVHINGKVEESRARRSALPFTQV